jgi:5-formyltetrahydrofolate cyclo-ligase
MTAKTIAREHGKAVRASLGLGDKSLLDQQIRDRCQRELDWASYRTIHLFLPIPRRNEIDTWPLLSWIWRTYPEKQVFVPRMLGTDIESVAINDKTVFGPNALGIPEPMRGRVLGESEKIDLVITPLLAFDQKGHRVGYGGGYYDRFLASHPEATTVGLAYEKCCIEPEIETGRYDIPLDMVVTSVAVHKFRQRRK